MIRLSLITSDKSSFTMLTNQAFVEGYNKTTKDVTLKIKLDPQAEKLLDEEKDVNPLDVLFSPDTEHRELNVTGMMRMAIILLMKIKIFSKKENRMKR